MLMVMMIHLSTVPMHCLVRMTVISCRTIIVFPFIIIVVAFISRLLRFEFRFIVSGNCCNLTGGVSAGRCVGGIGTGHLRGHADVIELCSQHLHATALLHRLALWRLHLTYRGTGQGFLGGLDRLKRVSGRGTICLFCNRIRGSSFGPFPIVLNPLPQRQFHVPLPLLEFLDEFIPSDNPIDVVLFRQLQRFNARVQETDEEVRFHL